MSDGYRLQSEAMFERVIRGAGSFDERAEALRAIVMELHKGLTAAHHRLSEVVDWQDWEAREQIAAPISDAALLCLHLDELLTGRGESGVRLRLMGAKAKGAPPDWGKRLATGKRDHRAARIVERLVRAGLQQEQAIWTVLAKRNGDGSARFGTTRDRIFAALKARREMRNFLPDATERELVSWLVG